MFNSLEQEVEMDMVCSNHMNLQRLKADNKIISPADLRAEIPTLLFPQTNSLKIRISQRHPQKCTHMIE